MNIHVASDEAAAWLQGRLDSALSGLCGRMMNEYTQREAEYAVANVVREGIQCGYIIEPQQLPIVRSRADKPAGLLTIDLLPPPAPIRPASPKPPHFHRPARPRVRVPGGHMRRELAGLRANYRTTADYMERAAEEAWRTQGQVSIECYYRWWGDAYRKQERRLVRIRQLEAKLGVPRWNGA